MPDSLHECGHLVRRSSFCSFEPVLVVMSRPPPRRHLTHVLVQLLHQRPAEMILSYHIVYKDANKDYKPFGGWRRQRRERCWRCCSAGGDGGRRRLARGHHAAAQARRVHVVAKQRSE